MSDHRYRFIEVVGSSPSSIEDAIKAAVDHAAARSRDIAWFQVVETRGHIIKGRVANFQVTVKIGFTLDSGS